MTPLLYQNAAPHHRDVLGHGPNSIGAAGCVLASIAGAAIDLGTRPALTMRTANQACIVADAFDGDALRVDVAAKAFGLHAPYSGRRVLGDGTDLAAVLVDTLKAGGRALLRIDHTGRRAEKGTHTILARALQPGHQQAECWCPAVGRIFVSIPGLVSDKAFWSKGDERVYRVVKVHPVVVLPA